MKKLLLILGIGILSLTGCNQVEDNIEALHYHDLELASMKVDDYKINQVCIKSHGGSCPKSYNENYYDENHRYELSIYWEYLYNCKNCNYENRDNSKETLRFNTYKEAKDYIKNLIND